MQPDFQFHATSGDFVPASQMGDEICLFNDGGSPSVFEIMSAGL
jgi:hypothetical protein